jgi:hypothetical protein
MKFIAIFLLLTVIGRAEDITVHVVETATLKPIAGTDIVLKSGCMHSVRPKVQQQKTDSAGTTIFHDVSLSGLESCVVVDSVSYASLDLPYIFASPQEAQNLGKSLNKVVTTLPAEVTFHVRHRTFSERLHYIFRFD